MAYVSTWFIEQALDTQLLATPGLPVFYPENIKTVQNGTTPFVRSTLSPARNVILSLGTKKVIEQSGLYQIDIFYPTALAVGSIRQMADAVINQFLPGFLELQDGNQLIIETAWSNPALNDMGTFLMIPVRVQWVIRTMV
jgi:hypothetical protein